MAVNIYSQPAQTQLRELPWDMMMKNAQVRAEVGAMKDKQYDDYYDLADKQDFSINRLSAADPYAKAIEQKYSTAAKTLTDKIDKGEDPNTVLRDLKKLNFEYNYSKQHGEIAGLENAYSAYQQNVKSLNENKKLLPEERKAGLTRASMEYEKTLKDFGKNENYGSYTSFDPVTLDKSIPEQAMDITTKIKAGTASDQQTQMLNDFAGRVINWEEIKPEEAYRIIDGYLRSIPENQAYLEDRAKLNSYFIDKNKLPVYNTETETWDKDVIKQFENDYIENAYRNATLPAAEAVSYRTMKTDSFKNDKAYKEWEMNRQKEIDDKQIPFYGEGPTFNYGQRVAKNPEVITEGISSSMDEMGKLQENLEKSTNADETIALKTKIANHRNKIEKLQGIQNQIISLFGKEDYESIKKANAQYDIAVNELNIAVANTNTNPGAVQGAINRKVAAEYALKTVNKDIEIKHGKKLDEITKSLNFSPVVSGTVSKNLETQTTNFFRSGAGWTIMNPNGMDLLEEGKDINKNNLKITNIMTEPDENGDIWFQAIDEVNKDDKGLPKTYYVKPLGNNNVVNVWINDFLSRKGDNSAKQTGEKLQSYISNNYSTMALEANRLGKPQEIFIPTSKDNKIDTQYIGKIEYSLNSLNEPVYKLRNSNGEVEEFILSSGETVSEFNTPTAIGEVLKKYSIKIASNK